MNLTASTQNVWMLTTAELREYPIGLGKIMRPLRRVDPFQKERTLMLNHLDCLKIPLLSSRCSSPDTTLFPPSLLTVTLVLAFVYFQLDVLPFIFSSLFSLTEIILWTFGAVTSHLA